VAFLKKNVVLKKSGFCEEEKYLCAMICIIQCCECVVPVEKEAFFNKMLLCNYVSKKLEDSVLILIFFFEHLLFKLIYW